MISGAARPGAARRGPAPAVDERLRLNHEEGQRSARCRSKKVVDCSSYPEIIVVGSAHRDRRRNRVAGAEVNLDGCQLDLQPGRDERQSPSSEVLPLGSPAKRNPVHRAATPASAARPALMRRSRGTVRPLAVAARGRWLVPEVDQQEHLHVAGSGVLAELAGPPSTSSKRSTGSAPCRMPGAAIRPGRDRRSRVPSRVRRALPWRPGVRCRRAARRRRARRPASSWRT